MTTPFVIILTEDKHIRLQVGTLIYLRQLKNLLGKEDITPGMELLNYLYELSPSIFHYLAEWDPSTLKIQDKNDESTSTLLQELILSDLPPVIIKY